MYQDTVKFQAAKFEGEITKKKSLISLACSINQRPLDTQDNTSGSKKFEPSGHKGLYMTNICLAVRDMPAPKLTQLTSFVNDKYLYGSACHINCKVCYDTIFATVTACRKNIQKIT